MKKPKTAKQFANMAAAVLDASVSTHMKISNFETEAYYAAEVAEVSGEVKPTPDSDLPKIGATLNAAIKATMKTLAQLERCREVHREMKRAKGSSAP